MRYQYDWQSGELSAWNPPVDQEQGSRFVDSTGGVYRLYAGGALYKGDQKVADAPFSLESIWLPHTHIFVKTGDDSTQPPESRNRLTLDLYDADTQQTRTVQTGLSYFSGIVGSSSDGKTIYLHESGDHQRK